MKYTFLLFSFFYDRVFFKIINWLIFEYLVKTIKNGAVITFEIIW